MKKIDLHTHTTASDGIYTPTRLIDLARDNGLVALAITDHDTVDGLSEAMEYGAKAGFRVFPGVEFSIEWPTGSFHLIGLNLDYRHEGLRNRVKTLSELRATRVHRIIDDLKKHGIDIPIHEVLAEAGDAAIGRPHVARVMVDRGYGPTIRDIFQNYLVPGKPGYVKKVRIEFDEAIALVKDAGGIPVVAHPVSLECRDMEEFEALLKGFVASGVEGIEAFASMHSPEMAQEYLALARKYNLLVTGGSDFHGDKDETIGNYQKDCPVPGELLDKLEAYIARKK